MQDVQQFDGRYVGKELNGTYDSEVSNPSSVFMQREEAVNSPEKE